MNYSAEEDAIKNYLTERFDNENIEIITLPEKSDDFEHVFKKRKVIVAFAGEEPIGDSKSVLFSYNEVWVNFSILLQSKTLRDVGAMPGIYSLLNLVKKFLIGFKTIGGEQLRYDGIKYEGHDKEIFQYVVNFKVKAIAVQATYTEEENGGPFKELNIIPE